MLEAEDKSFITLNAAEGAGRSAWVLGLGASGRAAAQYLNDHGWRVHAFDTREAPAGLDAFCKAVPGCEMTLGGFPETTAPGVELVVMSPGVSPYFGAAASVCASARKAGIPIVGEIELFAQELAYLKRTQGYAPKVIGITGTNGKTTTTTLTTKMAAAAGLYAVAAGNIGPNAVAELSKAEAAGALPDIWVLELSSFQLETTHTLNCTSAALLNITEDHINRFGSMEAYIAAKMRVFENQTEQDFAVLNADDPIVSAAETKAKKLYFSRLHEVRDGAFVRSGIIIFRMNGVETQLIPANELGIIGAHNLENALCAVCLAMSMGVKPDVVCNVLKSFKGVEHRIEYTRCLNGITFYNDSKGTNPESTVKAVEAMTKPTVLMLGVGNYDKQSDYRPVFRAFNGRVKAVVVNGSNTEAIMRAAKEEGFKNIYPCSDDFRALILKAASLAEPGDAVLLSPACASWGMFDNFEQRGDIFKEIVNSL